MALLGLSKLHSKQLFVIFFITRQLQLKLYVFYVKLFHT